MSLPELKSDEEFCEECEAELGSDDCEHCTCDGKSKKAPNCEVCEDCR